MLFKYNKGLLKAIDILNKTWLHYFDDEVLSKNEFRPIDAFKESLMNELNKALIDSSEVETPLRNELIKELIQLAIKPHYYCEDGWFSCPKAEGGCYNDEYKEGVCNCGADENNKRVEEIKNILKL